MRDRVSPRNARTPRASSFLKPTKSRAISTASRSLDAPSDALASSRSRGSSQNALRTFPTREPRAPEIVARVRDDRRRACDLPRRVDIGICPSSVRNIVPHRTHEHATRAEPLTAFSADRCFESPAAALRPDRTLRDRLSFRRGSTKLDRLFDEYAGATGAIAVVDGRTREDDRKHSETRS